MTEGPISKGLIIYSFPIIIGNFIQQFYNIADTLIVGRILGASALSAVGSSYSVMVLLTSIIIGLCMGASVVFAQFYGAGDIGSMRKSIYNSFFFIIGISFFINISSIILMEKIIFLLNVPSEALEYTRQYLLIVLIGMSAVSIYNFFSSILRSIGNTITPLVFVGISAILNIILDILFIAKFNMGVSGAAYATVISQIISAILSVLYYFLRCKKYHPMKDDMKYSREILKKIAENSLLTSVQQSIMNFGILMVQGLVNSFGYYVSAAFAIVVKIDSFAYMPAQDFGNAFSTFIAQNYGAKKYGRIQEGIKKSILISSTFCILVSIIIFIYSEKIIRIFIDGNDAENILSIGVGYLKIEGSFYIGIGILFLLYALYRGLGIPQVSIILTVISLGTRVMLAYFLSSFGSIGVYGIWWSVPIGWFLADLYGIYYFRRKNKKLLKIS